MIRGVIIALACLLAGCSATQSRYAEWVWQGMNGIDLIQTDQIARQPECYDEDHSLINMAVGSHPTRAEAAAVGLVLAATHLAVSNWLDGQAEERGGGWIPARTAWHVFGFARKSYLIGHNYDIGLWPGPGCQ